MTKTNKELNMNVIILFTVFGIMVVATMSYVDDAAQTTSTKRGLVPGPLPGGDIAGLGGGKIPTLVIVLLVGGLIAIPWLLRRKRKQN